MALTVYLARWTANNVTVVTPRQTDLCYLVLCLIKNLLLTEPSRGGLNWPGLSCAVSVSPACIHHWHNRWFVVYFIRTVLMLVACWTPIRHKLTS